MTVARAKVTVDCFDATSSGFANVSVVQQNDDDDDDDDVGSPRAQLWVGD